MTSEFASSDEAGGGDTRLGDVPMPLNSSQLAELVNRAKQSPAHHHRHLLRHSVRCDPVRPHLYRKRHPPLRLSRGPESGHCSRTTLLHPLPYRRRHLWRPRRSQSTPPRPSRYGALLKQIRFGHAEHLGENCWRVTLPDRRTTLPVRASKWTLLTILPKGWQPTHRPCPAHQPREDCG